MSTDPESPASAFEKKTYTYKKVGDLEIQADVYRSPGLESNPVVVWIHGGGLIGGHRGGIRKDHLGAYLDSGYTVVSIDYRLAPETKIPYIIEDLRDALAWVRKQGPRLFRIDPTRMGVVGHSAGGYLTLMSGICIDPPPNALVSFYGYGDIIADWYSKPDKFYLENRDRVSKEEALAALSDGPIANDEGTKGRGAFYLYCRQNGLWPKEVGGWDPHSNAAAFRPYCPEKNVTENYPPTLLLHGDQDTDVPYEQSVRMAEELDRRQVEHELITVKNGPHVFDSQNGGLRDPENAERFKKVIGFLDRHVKGE